MAVDSVNNTKTIEKILQDSNKSAKGRKTGEMGKDEFINLLVTQLQHQDPMNPTDDKEFIGQMAQFSALEQMQNLNASFASMKGSVFLGKHVKATYNDAATHSLKDVDGIVSDIKIDKDKVTAIVNGQEVPVDKITNITDDATKNIAVELAKYTGLIGLNVNGKVIDKNNIEVSVVGRVKEVMQDGSESVAMIDDVKMDIKDFVADKKYISTEDKSEYLKGMIGKKLTVTTKDEANDSYIRVDGTLNYFNISDNGKITVVMNDIKVPVSKITSVKDPRY